MQQRINISELEQGSHQTMIELERSVAGAGIDARTRHLIELRASIVNGCALSPAGRSRAPS